MFIKKRNVWVAVLLAAVSLGLACDGGQTDEANKLVDEGNALITKSNATSTKASGIFNELMGENMVKADDLEKYKADNKAKFDEAIGLYDQLEKDGNAAAAKFEQASKLKAGDKFQEYTGIKAQEIKKRAEIDKTSGAFLKSFLAEKDPEKADAQVGEYNKKAADMKKEADGIMAKAEQIVKDNPGVFKK